MTKDVLKFVFKYIYALVASVFLFTGGILFKNNRQLIKNIYNHFHWKRESPKPERLLPTIEYGALGITTSNVDILKPDSEDGNISLFETCIITQLIKTVSPENIFELGTYDGRTTLHMAANASEQAQVYTLDLPPEKLNETKYALDPSERKYVNKPQSGVYCVESEYKSRIQQLYGDSATFDFSPYYNTMDFIFIDASHTYDYVLHDSKEALKLLRNGKGIILWHDYTSWWDGVVRALNELYTDHSEFKNLKHIKDTSLVYLKLV